MDVNTCVDKVSATIDDSCEVKKTIMGNINCLVCKEGFYKTTWS